MSESVSGADLEDEAGSQPRPWTVTGSTPGYSDQFIRHRMDACLTERGHVLDPYHVIDLKDWCHVVALTPEGDIVLVEEYRHASGRVQRGLPAGTVEPGEDAETAMRRELTEETGYTAGAWITLNRVWVNPALQTNHVTSFLALDAVPGGTRALDPGETIAVMVRPVAEVLDQAMAGEPIAHAIQIMGLMLAREYARRHAHEDRRLMALTQ